MTATTQPETAPHTHQGSSSPSRDIALVAAFAALISASAYVGAIPVGSAGVPITLQTLTVMLAGCILGPLRGFSAVTLTSRSAPSGCRSSPSTRRGSACSPARAAAT